MSLSDLLKPVSFSQLPGWRQEDPSAAFAAFARCAARAGGRLYRTGGLGVAAESFAGALQAALENGPRASPAAAREFFQRHFRPCRIDAGGGFVTGYYEPELDASQRRTERYRVPLHRRPPDLVKVEPGDRPADLDPALAFARRDNGRLSAYHDRETIERGALDGRGLEIAWLADRVDAFFIHVQGAAKLHMNDGTILRVTYDAKTGHPFSSIGRVLADLGEIPLERVTMRTIRTWLAGHAARRDEILWRNRSYIFFRETPLGEPTLGPVAAAKVQLEPGRSIAVDRLLHTFGTPIYIDAPQLVTVDNGPFCRLTVAQDTGSAIVGPARGDLFIGTGDAAGEIAGSIKHPADFYALVPVSLLGGSVS